ncbi:MAG: polysaccharide deacetylase family protein [Pseudomonadota bacterium]
MASGHLTTRRASRLVLLAATVALAAQGAGASTCTKPVYLTLDTGHMGVAPLVAEVLQRQAIQVTFFVASEPTKTGGTSLDDQWAPWWKARVAEGHAFGSHTWDHGYWRADLSDQRFRIKQGFGPSAGQLQEWTAAQYCAELKRPAARLKAMTGATMLPLFRAPGGKTSPALLKATEACGFKHVPWAAAGFLGDELPSDKYPNTQLLEKALRSIRSGDILLAHLGIWSRQDPWAPAVLEPLVAGLKAKGFCFATLREHPDYRSWIAAHAASVQ